MSFSEKVQFSPITPDVGASSRKYGRLGASVHDKVLLIKRGAWITSLLFLRFKLSFIAQRCMLKYN